MPIATLRAVIRLYAASIVLLGLASTAQATVTASDPAQFSIRTITCEFPVRLTHDCSIWRGATRSVAFGDYRMTLAADSAGRTVLISQLRVAPSHNGPDFVATLGSSRKHSSADAIRRLETALADHGIRLERMQPVRRGRRVDGYFLEFSDNAYDFLKQFTVLESEQWLPRQRDVR